MPLQRSWLAGSGVTGGWITLNTGGAIPLTLRDFRDLGTNTIAVITLVTAITEQEDFFIVAFLADFANDIIWGALSMFGG